jgi:hypothetical protein
MPVRRKFLAFVIVALVLVAVVAIGVLWLLTVPPPLERRLQTRVQEALSEHFHRDVQLHNLHVTLLPVFRVSADAFVLPNRDPENQPAFIAIKHFTAEADPLELWRSPIHIHSLKLDGLVITIAPKSEAAKENENKDKPKKPRHLANFVIDRVDADGTLLYILSKNPDRDAMEFDLRKLHLQSAGIGQPMAFQAELTNPKPPGDIHTTGKFGPWNMDDPAETAVSGHYTFEHADLSIFNGISGILSSSGDYNGQLNNIVVDGTTDTPDFKLDSGAKAVHLITKFHAIVDGTKGDTYLQPVDASFLHSHVIAAGQVAGKKGQKGKTIQLDIDIHDSRIEDMLALATDKGALLTGGVTTKAKLVIPPGDQKVMQKIFLAGRFAVKDGHFPNPEVQSKLDALSRRGQGKPDAMEIQNVAANFDGVFKLDDARMSFRQLHFDVPGVQVELQGAYSIAKQELDFKGDVRLQATVSQTQKGIKHWVTVPFDPLFKKNGAGTYLPVNIQGTTDHPKIGLDWKKVL